MKMRFENIKPNEGNEMLEKLKIQVASLIKDRRAVTEYCGAIEDVVSAYADPAEASRILAENFEKYVKHDFTEKNFNRFIRSIDPRVVHRRDMEEDFWEWERSDEDCTKEVVGECAENDELCDGDCEEKFMSKHKTRMVEMQKKYPQRMQSLRIYAFLQEDKITDQDRLAMELAPNKGPDPFAWNRMPRIPLGGQPGYKIKRRRP